MSLDIITFMKRERAYCLLVYLINWQHSVYYCDTLKVPHPSQQAEAGNALEDWRNTEKGEVEPQAFCGSPRRRQLMLAYRIRSDREDGGGGPITIITVMLRALLSMESQAT